MAIGSYAGVCPQCGQEYEYRKTCRNRADADRYEAWCAANITLCKACAAKAHAAQAADRVTEILQQYDVTLPAITGVSDKQTAYAESKRAREIGRDLPALEKYCKTLQGFRELIRTQHDAIMAGLAQLGITTMEGGISNAMAEIGLGDLHNLMTETSARKIIDMVVDREEERKVARICGF